MVIKEKQLEAFTMLNTVNAIDMLKGLTMTKNNKRLEQLLTSERKKLKTAYLTSQTDRNHQLFKIADSRLENYKLNQRI